MAAPCFGESTAEPKARPNVIFILVDDLRWNALGCMGHPFVQTPNIDRLAKEGALFRNAFVTSPYCSPSRASFLTGHYAHKHGVLVNGEKGEPISHKLITFPLLLQKAGYATAYVGKWHMGDDDTPRPGFDRWVSFKGQGPYRNPQFNIDGKQVKVQGYMTDLLNDYASQYVRQPHDKPFVLYLGHKGLYADQPIPRSPSATGKLDDDKPLYHRTGVRTHDSIGPRAGAGDEQIRDQLRCLLAIDEGVGKLYQDLRDTKQLDNTLIIFTSDNGFMWGEHGLGNKMAAYEESIRIPMVMRYPPLIKPGTVIEQEALNVDIAPTLLELGGAPISPGMHGRSLVPLFKGPVADWRKSFLAEYFDDSNEVIPNWQAVRTERWKYIHYQDLQGMDELYDLRADPLEMKNLINDPAAKASLEEMKAELQRLLAQTQ